jgi:prevent-host-death family protein
MDNARTMSITEARKNIFDLAAKTQTPGVYFTLTEKGKPSVVMMSSEEFESWMETLDIVTEFPNIKKELEHAEAQVRLGETVSLEKLKLAYAVPPRSLKGRTKKSR